MAWGQYRNAISGYYLKADKKAKTVIMSQNSINISLKGPSSNWIVGQQEFLFI